MHHLEQRCHDLIEDLERAGISANRLGNLELARYYQACVHSQQTKEYSLFASNVDAIDRPLKLRKGILEQTETTALALQDALIY